MYCDHSRILVLPSALFSMVTLFLKHIVLRTSEPASRDYRVRVGFYLVRNACGLSITLSEQSASSVRHPVHLHGLVHPLRAVLSGQVWVVVRISARTFSAWILPTERQLEELLALCETGCSSRRVDTGDPSYDLETTLVRLGVLRQA